MRVNDTMIERLRAALAGRMAWPPTRAAARDALEAALADERDPLHTDAVWQMKLDTAERDAAAMLRRYKVLQAKLAKVLEWQRSETIEAKAAERLYAILADKENG